MEKQPAAAPEMGLRLLIFSGAQISPAFSLQELFRFGGIGHDDVRAGLLADGAAVQGQVVVGQVAPLALGQVVVVGLPGGVREW